MEDTSQRIPGVSDSASRRYRVKQFDIDGRASILIQYDQADEAGKKAWEEMRKGIVAGLATQFGAHNLDQKITDFTAMGMKPFSIVAHHNVMFNHVRDAFTSGAYYAALTAACALGERLFNHLILDLRDNFKSSPHYRRVYNKESFLDWDKAVMYLNDWDIILPNVATALTSLKDIRHRSLHFNIETANSLRVDALSAIQHLRDRLRMG